MVPPLVKASLVTVSEVGTDRLLSLGAGVSADAAVVAGPAAGAAPPEHPASRRARPTTAAAFILIVLSLPVTTGTSYFSTNVMSKRSGVKEIELLR
jgi:hypothetical protein